ncbi:hypothetical protein E3Q22_03319 [Wallemia mellicola]|uniref:Mitochondrial cytochrome c oxidase assembly factor n=1 Tax=Wallemia mellicola TaxID=1708541 RepID=A0A4V4MTR8_9BASI|nr:hypothetical protein E3Q23_02576 [Wallemia mellicola]TIB76880.1 hypothetical protein E3Q22_03319 [Wallemia mellicola]TIB97033.1 hypothetical protein E3Q18_02823 [Wallemia mellicola]TIB99540.1 hypothetical protein E3Q17_02561 [Wallemia mellicola]TIC04536.1 hypothetical protein E3Q16_02671 [Wallemia mellicola]
MGGANLEVFKFAAYLFFPIAFMYHFGDPDWYERHVEPAKEAFWPKEEETHKPAKDPQSLRAQLEEIKSRRKNGATGKQSQQEQQPQRLV